MNKVPHNRSINEHPDCPFIGIYYENHRPDGVRKEKDERYAHQEKMFLSFFHIGVFETYKFLYQDCQNLQQFQQWLINIKGIESYLQSVQDFNTWYTSGKKSVEDSLSKLLTDEQMDFWLQNGYLKVPALIEAKDCDAVVKLIINILGIDPDDDKSWYPNHELLQGMMLQCYQDESILNIRNDKKLERVFAQLYDNNNIIPNTEKLSYNPPENEQYRFRGSPLHWDIDFSKGIQYHIQGLIYLNDVPAERGALTLIPGFHHEIDQFLAECPNPHLAIQKLAAENRQIPVAGGRGDLIVWLEALPHAASPNCSDQPRLVQYVSFTSVEPVL